MTGGRIDARLCVAVQPGDVACDRERLPDGGDVTEAREGVGDLQDLVD